MKSFVKESKKIIRKAKNNNKLVIFVGSGVSLNSGFPSWKELINEFAKGIGIEKNKFTEDDYLKIPQYYYNLRKKKEYYELINEVFNINAKPNIIHDLILQFNPNNIITTNYDKLIEEAAEEKGMFYDVVSRDEDLPYTQNNKMIIKMHGDLTYNNIVLKEEDFLSYSSNFKLIENYVKSLLSSNVILFIGYSISDINIKIIFQWVKDILKKDFQPAYFINTDEEYNHIQFDYYKKRGINILYHSEGKKLDSFPNESSKLSSPQGNNLYNFLLYLLNDKEIYDLDFYYNKLLYLDFLNKVRIKDIRKVLEITSQVREEGNNLIVKDSSKLDYLIDKFKKWKSNKIKDKDEITKLMLINRVFNKANVDIIKVRENGKDKVLYEFDYDEVLNDMPKLVLNYNYGEIRNQVERKYGNHIIDGNEYEFIGKAYGLYQTGCYYKAYEILKNVSKIAFKNKKYIVYFISEFNREHVGDIISKSYIWIDIDKNIAQNVKNEIKKIDLDELFLKLPEDERNSLSFIKEIMNFKFVYLNNNKVSRLSEEIKKEKDTIYLGNPKNGGKIHKLRRDANKFWDFINNNYLMIDNYQEIKKYFYKFIESTLFSYSIVKDEVKRDSLFGLKGRTMKIKDIDYFTFFIMTKYLKRKELKYLFNEYDVYQLEMKPDNLNQTIKAFKNIVSSFSILKRDNKITQVFNRFLYLFSYVDIGKDYFVDVINCVISLLKQKNLRYENYRDILSFIIGQNNRFKENINVKKIDELLKELMLLEIQNDKNKDLFFGVKPFRTLTNIINYNDKEFITNSKKFVIVLIEKGKDLINVNEKKGVNYLINIVVPIYKICDQDIKNEIKIIIESILDENFYFKLYYESVINGIIKSNEEYEIKAAEAIQKEIDKKNNSDSRSFPDPVETLLIEIGNLYLNNELVCPNKFCEFEGEHDMFDLFINIDDYDYSKFKLKWISEFTDSLHKEISKNNNAKKIIKNKLKEKIINENIDKEIKKIFFNYYD